MIHVIATINTRPGHRQQVLAELLKVRPEVLDEAGCHQYLPLEDEPGQIPRQLPYRDDTITLMEQWESVQHLEAHLATPHMRRYLARVESWVEQVSLQILRASL